MKDLDRERLLKRYASGYVIFWVLAIAISVMAGKEYGRWLALTVFPAYLVFYITSYRKHCKQYQDESRRILAFSLGRSGTFIEALYYASIALLVMAAILLAMLLVGFFRWYLV